MKTEPDNEASSMTEMAQKDPLEFEQAKALIDVEGVEALSVDDLSKEDLDNIGWSGSSTHIQHVAKAIERAENGEIEYLAVRAPNGPPIAKGGIDYTERLGAGTMWQLSTCSELQGLGIGTKLIAEAEKRIKGRGLTTAVVGVEDDNPRARQLYERLGYTAYDKKNESWEEEDGDGNKRTHQTEVTLLRKSL